MSRVAFCPSCGAALEGHWEHVTVVCRYCKVHVMPGERGEPVPQRMPDDGRPRLSVAGRTYLLEGHLAAGDNAEVYRGRWVVRLGELVVVKIARNTEGAQALRHEKAFLDRLWSSPARGGDHFVHRLPPPIDLAPIDVAGVERVVSVLRWRSGFHTSLTRAMQAHPDGIDGRVLVWIFKRMLELLAFTHASGVVHGAITPDHVLLHPRDHGAMLVGWGAATSWSASGGEVLPRRVDRHRALYPDAEWGGHVTSPVTDLAMLARTVRHAAQAGSWLDRHGSLHPAVGRIARQAAAGEFEDAWSLREAIDQASHKAYGPPSYNPLRMPGWSARPR